VRPDLWIDLLDLLLCNFPRHDEGNPFPLVTAVDAEIPIHGNDGMTRVTFTQANEAKVGEIRRTIGIAFGEHGESLAVVGNRKIKADESGFDQCEGYLGRSDVKGRFGEHGLASNQWYGKSTCQVHRPAMESITAIEERD